MSFLNKFLALTFTFLILASLIIISITPTEVNAAQKPSVPQFTIKLVDYSYDVPSVTTTITDPYTGEKTTTTTPGYRVENKTIEITIKKQPFTPYVENGVKYYLFYFVESKGHYSEEWQDWGSTVEQNDPMRGIEPAPSYSRDSTVSGSATHYVVGAQVDFRVEARIGHYYCINPDNFWPLMAFTADTTSGWSNVQTFIIPGSSPTITPPQTATPPEKPDTTSNNNQPQTPDFVFNPLFLLGVGIIVGVVAVTVVLIFTKRYTTSQTLIKQQTHKLQIKSHFSQRDFRG